MTEQQCRLPFEKMAEQCRSLNEAILRRDFDGFIALDPTLNKGLTYIHQADEVIATYPQGAFPLDYAYESVKETLRLLRRCRERYGRDKPKHMEQAFRRHFRLWFYFGSPQHPPELFAKKLFESERRLGDAICEHNAGIREPRRQRQRPHQMRTDTRDNKAAVVACLRGILFPLLGLNRTDQLKVLDAMSVRKVAEISGVRYQTVTRMIRAKWKRGGCATDTLEQLLYNLCTDETAFVAFETAAKASPTPWERKPDEELHHLIKSIVSK